MFTEGIFQKCQSVVIFLWPPVSKLVLLVCHVGQRAVPYAYECRKLVSRCRVEVVRRLFVAGRRRLMITSISTLSRGPLSGVGLQGFRGVGLASFLSVSGRGPLFSSRKTHFQKCQVWYKVDGNLMARGRGKDH